MKKYKTILILSCFILILGWLNIQQQMAKKIVKGTLAQKPLLPAATSAVNQKPAPAQDNLSVTFDLLELTSSRKRETLGNDPFLKIDFKTVTQNAPLNISNMVLSGIIINEPDVPAALINDQILKPGDTLGTYRIETITPNEVVLSQGTERFVLRLFAGDDTKRGK